MARFKRTFSEAAAMSKQGNTSTSGSETGSPAAGHAPHANHAARRSGFFSAPIVVALVVIVAGGAGYGATRNSRVEARILKALDNCGAQVQRAQDSATKLREPSGLNDYYALPRFNPDYADPICDYLGYCHSDPALALRIYRAALDNGKPSAQMMALHSAFFLAESRALQQEDWERLIKRLDSSNDPDVQRLALRAFSDLTQIQPTKSRAGLISNPPDFKEPDADAPRPQILLKDGKRDEKDVIYIRWTSPALAKAWLAVHGSRGAWNVAEGRYIVQPESEK